MMTKYWTLSEEFYQAFHRWPTILAFLILGFLAGWGTSYILPAYYRATVQVYVGLDPYRAYSDAAFLALSRPKYSNVDDFKNWQMSQLDGSIYLDEFIQATLSQLRQEDPYWNNIEATDLRSMLTAEWRTAGTWSLVAKDPDSKHATQAVTTWSKVVVERAKNAVLAARNTFMIDQNMQALADQRVTANQRLEELSDTQKELLFWIKNAQAFPQNQPLPNVERWSVLSIATRLAEFTPAWMAILQDQPAPTSSPGAYSAWITQITTYIDSEIPTLQQQIRLLDAQRTDLAVEYAQEADSSLGISPNLEIERVDQATLTPVRLTGVLTIIGGIVGLLIWILSRLAIITHSGVYRNRKTTQ